MQRWWLPVILPIILSSFIGGIVGVIGFSVKVATQATSDKDFEHAQTVAYADLKEQVNQNTSDIVVLKSEYSAQSQQNIDILANLQDIRTQLEKLLFMHEKS